MHSTSQVGLATYQVTRDHRELTPSIVDHQICSLKSSRKTLTFCLQICSHTIQPFLKSQCNLVKSALLRFVLTWPCASHIINTSAFFLVLPLGAELKWVSVSHLFRQNKWLRVCGSIFHFAPMKIVILKGGRGRKKHLSLEANDGQEVYLWMEVPLVHFWERIII